MLGLLALFYAIFFSYTLTKEAKVTHGHSITFLLTFRVMDTFFADTVTTTYSRRYDDCIYGQWYTDERRDCDRGDR